MYGGDDEGLNDGEVFLDRSAPRPTRSRARPVRASAIPSTPVCEVRYRTVRLANGAEFLDPVKVCYDPHTGVWR